MAPPAEEAKPAASAPAEEAKAAEPEVAEEAKPVAEAPAEAAKPEVPEIAEEAKPAAEAPAEEADAAKNDDVETRSDWRRRMRRAALETNALHPTTRALLKNCKAGRKIGKNK